MSDGEPETQRHSQEPDEDPPVAPVESPAPAAAGSAEAPGTGTTPARFARWIDATTAQLTVTAICLALLLAAIGYRVVADDGQDPMPQATRAAAPPDNRAYTIPKASPRDNGTVRVVEQGFSPIKDSAGDDLVSYGAILSNTSRKMAAVVSLSLRIVDARGKSVVGRISEYALSQEVAIILPGQRAGISGCVYIERPTVASVTFTVAKVGWIAVDPKRRHSAALTAKVLRTGWQKGRGKTLHWDEEGISAVPASDKLVVRFQVESAYTTLLKRPAVSMVFRDAKGAIVGGSPRHNLGVYSEFPPGDSRHVMRVKYGPPTGVDLSKIEVYPYPR